MKKSKRVFSSFSFFITVVTIKKKTTLWMLFVNINRLKKKYSYIQQSKRHSAFFVDRESRSALMELHTWNGLDLGFM